MNSHPDTGTLRRLIDEPQHVDAVQRAHAQSCEQCAREMKSLQAAAASASAALRVETHPDAQYALTKVSVRASQRTAKPAAAYRRFGGAVAAAALVAALIFTPLGSYARSFLTIFEPQEFQPIELSAEQVRNFRLLPQVNQFGTQRIVTPARRTQYASLAQAAKHLSFVPQLPQALPRGISSKVAYFVSAPSEWTFTFSAAKARAFAARSHRALPSMPADLDGTTLRVRMGALFEARYGSGHSLLEVVQTTAPVVSSTGATLEQLEAYLLKMPGVSPQLVQQLHTIVDAQTTLPVPIDVSRQHAQKVTVRGAQGLGIGDNTGLGAGVMWREGRALHVVAGSVSMDDALTVADGLK
jgi:hypothetical protein